MRRSVLLAALLVTACASSPEERPAPAAAAASAADEAPTGEEAPADAEESPLPSSIDEAAKKLEFVCPPPSFSFDEPARVEAGGETIVIRGDTARRESEGEGPLVIGVLGAIKDSSDDTRQNLKRARAAFDKRGVKIVLAGGDLGEDGDLENVFRMLGETFDKPILLHAGNMEWTSAFAKAWERARKDHPQLINGNFLHEVQLTDELWLLVLPGYHQLQFLRSGACRYTDADIGRLRDRAAQLTAEGHVVAIASHGPPHGKGKRALDVVYDDGGNVGDERLTELIERAGVRYGLFNHILESGGRACADPACKEPLRLPVTKKSARLFVNAGTASGLGWEMLSGSRTGGMAMVVELGTDGATAELLPLR